ncbi:LytTR family DNA-binding domain-containing protein [Chitinophaga sp. CF418]|uniref:LytR/AlgR family response regulator transcription factor n=1 Tax=Chitinophaga sp. CF418 TaxID=1855287 RepID=UPI00091D2892|nr:LytTR family DNA-binding domain-containing protein [Chitinophaga sp. CF418]SHN03132.1 two component transcriptional regulator, LytTR family [Chitinophaga sp. CF418]
MRTLIIENDTEAFQQLKTLLEELAPEQKIAGHCSSIKDTMQWLQHNAAPDLIFSVVQLPDGLSFEIFKKLENRVPVIFTCKYDKHAIAAFKANGIYYIVKPVKKSELREALKRYDICFARGRGHYKTNLPSVQMPSRYQERFMVSVGAQMKLLKTEDIAYFYTENKVVYLVTFDGMKYAVDYTLEQLYLLLDLHFFFRINRQFIINISAIVQMAPASKSRLKLTLRPATDRNTITSFERTENFRKWVLGGY